MSPNSCVFDGPCSSQLPALHNRSLVTGCSYLEFLDAGAGIVGEALCVRDLDVFPVQNPSQVISYLWTETNRELGWAVARKDEFVSTG